jgi:hypothetical protein
MVPIDTFGWVGLDSLTETEDGENRRQRRRSMRADVVQILWRGNTWRMPKGCVLRHAMAQGLFKAVYVKINIQPSSFHQFRLLELLARASIQYGIRARRS